MIVDLVRRCRRRYLLNQAISQSAWAASIALACVILLLLAGTQLLDWRWLGGIPLLALGFGLYRILRRIPSAYRIAQLIDRRLQLPDTVSTALFFSTVPAPKGSEPVRRAQLEQAEQVCRDIGSRQAVPFTAPRSMYVMALLALIASSLFALRYGIERRMDLRPPLAHIIREALFGVETAKDQPEHQKDRITRQRRPELRDALGMALPDGERKTPGDLDAAPDSALDSIGVPDVDNSNRPGNSQAASKTPGKDGEETRASRQDESESSEEGQASGDNTPEAERAGARNGKNGEEGSRGSPSSSGGENSSLMSRLRDAMSNLMSRMRQQPGSGASQRASNSGQNGAGNKVPQGEGQKGSPGQGQAQPGGKDGGESQQSGQGDDLQNAQNAQGRGSGPDSQQQARNQPGSGIGKQDGSKDLKAAEQLAAMGKISEIIGKRSATVSGDMTVEVQSSNQQLRTQYSRSEAQHTDAGGEISRDAVPVDLQPYVQQYFEQIRKQPPPRHREQPSSSPR
jgi:hypothetical protein